MRMNSPVEAGGGGEQLQTPNNALLLSFVINISNHDDFCNRNCIYMVYNEA